MFVWVCGCVKDVRNYSLLLFPSFPFSPTYLFGWAEEEGAEEEEREEMGSDVELGEEGGGGGVLEREVRKGRGKREKGGRNTLQERQEGGREGF